MKKHLILYLSSVLLLATACGEDDEGNAFDAWDGGMELSAETVTLNDDALSQTIYVGEGQSGWYITRVTTGDDETLLGEAEQEAMRNGEGLERTFDWLTVAVEGNAITLTAAENPGWDRTFGIDVAAYGCASRIEGRQLAATDDTPLTATPDNVLMSFRGGTATIETSKTNWWIASLTVDGTEYAPYAAEGRSVGERPTDRTVDKVFGWLGVKVEGSLLILSAEKNRKQADNQTFAITLTDGTQECTVNGLQYCIIREPDENAEIKVSPDEVEFGLEGGEVAVKTTNYENWWFSFIKVDGELQDLGLHLQEDRDLLTKKRIFKRTLDWLTVEVVGADGLRLTAAPNTTGQERTFEVEFCLFDYTGTLTGVQRAE